MRPFLGWWRNKFTHVCRMSTLKKGDCVLYEGWSAEVINPKTYYGTILIKFDRKIVPNHAKNNNLPGPQGQDEMYINLPDSLKKCPTNGGRHKVRKLRKLCRSTKRRRSTKLRRSSRR